MKPSNAPPDDAFSAEVQRALRELPDAPAALQRAAIGLWVAPPPRLGDVAVAALRLVSAVLRVDSWGAGQSAAAQGLRALRSPTRHLLFSAEGRDVDLRIVPAAQGFVLAGQILGPDEGGAVELVALDVDGGLAHRVAIDALGEFRIEGLAAGRYELTLRLGTDQIVMPPLQVGDLAVEAGS